MDSCFSHVAFLIPSVETSIQMLKTFGIDAGEPESFESEGTKEVYVGSYANQSGLLLLIEAMGPGPYQRALHKRGPGLHHIAIDVLNMDRFTAKAEGLGWKLHPVSEETMDYDTAWFYIKDFPTLLEVQQKKGLSTKPALISKLGIPMEKGALSHFEGIGVGEIVEHSKDLFVTIDGQRLNFSQVAPAH